MDESYKPQTRIGFNVSMKLNLIGEATEMWRVCV